MRWQRQIETKFRVELANRDFVDRLLGLLALNRRGSFMGVDEGRLKAEGLFSTQNGKKRRSQSGRLFV